MTEAAKSVGEQVGDLAHAVGGVVRKKAEEIADRSRETGAKLASGLGEKAGVVADRIEEKSPSLAQHVRDTADKVNQFADELNDKKAADLLQSAMDFGRAHPFMMLAGAALVGFALARVVGPGSADRSKSHIDSVS